jgi:hypothetical protein
LIMFYNGSFFILSRVLVIIDGVWIGE